MAYREFYDVPRMFVVETAHGLLVFDCPFDDSADEYALSYAVHRLPAGDEKRLEGDWSELVANGEVLGGVPVSEVRFDTTRRRFVARDVIDRFAGLSGEDSRGGQPGGTGSGS